MPSILTGKHVDASEYRDLYRRTRNLRPEIRREMRKRLREAAKIGQRAARLKIREMPATAKYSKTGAGRHYRKSRPGTGVGLRSTLALNIRVQVTARDVAVRQFTAGLRGHNARDLPRDIDKGYWRHPVYGHPPKVLQKGWPYFDRTMRAKRPEMEREVRKVLDSIKVELLKSRIRSLGRAA